MTRTRRWFVRIGVALGVLFIALGMLIGVLGSLSYTKKYTVDGIITDYGTKYGFPGYADAVYVQPGGFFIYFHSPTGLKSGDTLEREYDGLRRTTGYRFNGQFRHTRPRPTSAHLGAAIGILGGLCVAGLSVLVGRRRDVPLNQRTPEWRRRRLRTAGAGLLVAAAAEAVSAVAGSNSGAGVACVLFVLAGTLMRRQAHGLKAAEGKAPPPTVRPGNDAPSPGPLYAPPLVVPESRASNASPPRGALYKLGQLFPRMRGADEPTKRRHIFGVLNLVLLVPVVVAQRAFTNDGSDDGWSLAEALAVFGMFLGLALVNAWHLGLLTRTMQPIRRYAVPAVYLAIGVFFPVLGLLTS